VDELVGLVCQDDQANDIAIQPVSPHMVRRRLRFVDLPDGKFRSKL